MWCARSGRPCPGSGAGFTAAVSPLLTEPIAVPLRIITSVIPAGGDLMAMILSGAGGGLWSV